jgi:RsmE family RNA methyltransferase
LDCEDEDDEMKTSPPRAARAVVLDHCGKSSSTTTTTTTTTTKTTATTPPSAIIAIGPERGWTTDEAALFTTECGFEAATLGNSILRVDTAVIAGIGIVSAALDECYELLARGRIIRGEEKEDVKRQRKDR